MNLSKMQIDDLRLRAKIFHLSLPEQRQLAESVGQLQDMLETLLGYIATLTAVHGSTVEIEMPLEGRFKNLSIDQDQLKQTNGEGKECIIAKESSTGIINFYWRTK